VVSREAAFKWHEFESGHLSGAKGTRTPDPHTASVKRDVLSRIAVSTAARSVHVKGGLPCRSVYCVLAGSRES